MVNTASFNLGKWLQKFVKPISYSKYCVKDSFEAASKIKDFEWNSSFKIGSFDIENFFPSVPVRKAVDMVVKAIMERNIVSIEHSDILKELLLGCCVDNIVDFNGNLWKQIDGVAMGSPLSADLSNAFLSLMEEEHFKNENSLFKLYMRYVDDTFVITENEEQEQKLFTSMNTWDNKIILTRENYNNQDGLSFLDILITKGTDHLTTSVFHKKSDTLLAMKFDSAIPIRYKKGLIYCKAWRALKICSNWINVHKELEHIRMLLKNNGFPEGLIDKQFNKVLLKHSLGILENKETKPLTNDNTYVLIPYENSLSEDFGFQIKKIFEDCCPNN